MSPFMSDVSAVSNVHRVLNNASFTVMRTSHRRATGCAISRRCGEKLGVRRAGDTSEARARSIHQLLGAVEVSQLIFNRIANVSGISLNFRTLHNIMPRCALTETAKRTNAVACKYKRHSLGCGQAVQVVINMQIFNTGTAKGAVHSEQGTT